MGIYINQKIKIKKIKKMFFQEYGLSIHIYKNLLLVDDEVHLKDIRELNSEEQAWINHFQDIEHTPKHLLKEEIFVLNAIKKHHSILKYVPKKMMKDKRFILKAININPMSLQYFSKKVRKNKEVVLVAVKIFGKAVYFASKRLKRDAEIKQEAILNDPESIIYFEDNKIEEVRNATKSN